MFHCKLFVAVHYLRGIYSIIVLTLILAFFPGGLVAPYIKGKGAVVGAGLPGFKSL